MADAICLELMRLMENDETIDKAVENYCWGVEDKPTHVPLARVGHALACPFAPSPLRLRRVNHSERRKRLPVEPPIPGKQRLQQLLGCLVAIQQSLLTLLHTEACPR